MVSLLQPLSQKPWYLVEILLQTESLELYQN